MILLRGITLIVFIAGLVVSIVTTNQSSDLAGIQSTCLENLMEISQLQQTTTLMTLDSSLAEQDTLERLLQELEGLESFRNLICDDANDLSRRVAFLNVLANSMAALFGLLAGLLLGGLGILPTTSSPISSVGRSDVGD